MKPWCIILLMLLSANVFAQRLNGVVIDKVTGIPVPGAIVKTKTLGQATLRDGYFSIPTPRFGDTVKITSLGYKTYVFTISTPRKDTLRIELQPTSIMLNNVNILAPHDRQMDSLQNRKEFSHAFGYKAPTLMDAFIKIDPNAYIPNNYINATNSTASIASVDLLSLSSLFGKNKTPASKLHRLVINEEKLNYVDERFSRPKVIALTKLQGDSLQTFIYLYRPQIDALKKMSEYDLQEYIKKSLADFRSGKNKDKIPVIR